MHWYLHSCRELQRNPFVVWFTMSVPVSILIWVTHYLSAFVTVGSMAMVSLRILGVAARSQAITQVSRFYAPWMWTGLSVLTFTGLLMLAGDAALFCTNVVFAINLLITALAAVSGVVIRRRVSEWDQPLGPPRKAKVFAGVSLFLWIATILSAVGVPALSNVP
jgi:hypothetical protein